MGGFLVGSPLLEEEALKSPYYGKISFILLPNPSGVRDHFMMKVDLRYTKGHNSRPKRFH